MNIYIAARQCIFTLYYECQLARKRRSIFAVAVLNLPGQGAQSCAEYSEGPNISYDDVKKRYYVNLYYGIDPITGKPIKKTKTFVEKKLAKQALKAFEADKIKNNIAMPTLYTMQTWLKYWINNKERTCRATTIYGYKNIIDNHIIPAIGHVKLQDITTEHINRYLTYIQKEKGLDLATIVKHYELLKSTLKFAVREKKLVYNPIDDVEKPKFHSKEQNVYSLEQLRNLFELVENDRIEIVVKLGGYLGLRREEISGLKWTNVDLTNHLIYIREGLTQAGKGIIPSIPKSENSIRTLGYLNEKEDEKTNELHQALLKVKNQQEEYKTALGKGYIDNGFVVAWPDGRPYRPNYLSDLFKKFLEDNNLLPLTLHGLRHTFASVANQLHVSIYEISKALGHSNVTVTNKIYVHMFDKTNQNIIRSVSNGLKVSDSK